MYKMFAQKMVAHKELPGAKKKKRTKDVFFKKRSLVIPGG